MRDNSEVTASVQSIETFLQTIVADSPVPKPGPRKAGPPQVLSSLCLWSAVLVGIVHKFTSILSIWRLISIDGFWNFMPAGISDEAVYSRLKQGGTAPLENLFHQVTTVLKERISPFVNNNLASFFTMIVAIDESTLDKVSKKLPVFKNKKSEDVFLPGKISSLFDIRAQQWVKFLFTTNSAQNEKVMARETISELPFGSLIVGDLGYFGFKWFDDLSNLGFYWISRLRAKTSYTVEHVFYEKNGVFDGLVWLGAYRADKAANMVRLVKFKIRDTQFEYLTSVLDPRKLSIKMITEIYGRRWDIEIAFNLIKTHLKLNFIWSGEEQVWMQQVIGVLIISQILQAFRVEIAGKAKVDVYDVSMSVMIQVIPLYVKANKDFIEEIVRDGNRLLIIRASRRVKKEGPEVKEEELVPIPEGLVLVRKARYAAKS